jgi:hypothetical protein
MVALSGSVAGAGTGRLPTRQGRYASLRDRPAARALDPRGPAALGRGTAGRAVALPASRARHLVSPAGAFPIGAGCAYAASRWPISSMGLR